MDETDVLEVVDAEDDCVQDQSHDRRQADDARHDILGTKALVDRYYLSNARTHLEPPPPVGLPNVRLIEKHAGGASAPGGLLPIRDNSGGLRTLIDRDAYDDEIAGADDDDGDDILLDGNDFDDKRDRQLAMRMVSRLVAGKPVEGDDVDGSPSQEEGEHGLEDEGEGDEAGGAKPRIAGDTSYSYGPEGSLKGILIRSGLGEQEVVAAIQHGAAVSKPAAGDWGGDFDRWIAQGGRLGKAANAEADFFTSEEAEDDEDDEDDGGAEQEKGQSSHSATMITDAAGTSWSLIPPTSACLQPPLMLSTTALARSPAIAAETKKSALAAKEETGAGSSADRKASQEKRVRIAEMEIDGQEEEEETAGTGYSETAPSFSFAGPLAAAATGHARPLAAAFGADEEEWPLKPEFRGSSAGGPRGPSLSQLPRSDAVLSCPFCFHVLTRLCQRHQSVENRFRAADAEGAVVDWTGVSGFAAAGGPRVSGRLFPLRCRACKTVVGEYERLPTGSAGSSSSLSRGDDTADALEGIFHFEGVVEGEG